MKRLLTLIFFLLIFLPGLCFSQDASIDPDLVVWDFGSVEIGDTSSSDIRIYSIDPFSPLVIYSVEILDLIGGDSDDPFRITGIDPDPIPPELFEDQYIDVTVTFTPLFAGIFDDYRFVLHSNDHDEEYINIFLTGVGLPQSQTQVPEPSSMLLFAIGMLSVVNVLRKKSRNTTR